MEKKNLIWTGLGLVIGAGLSSYFLKKSNKEKQSKESKSIKEDEDKIEVNSIKKPLNYEEAVKRLMKYSNEFTSSYYKYHSNLKRNYLKPWKFPEEYYLFCINTLWGDLGISIVSGTNKNGFITQEEAYEFFFSVDDFNELDRDKIFPKFKISPSKVEKPREVEKFKNEKFGTVYSFGLAVWCGEGDYIYGDGGWYRSTTWDDWHEFSRRNLGKPGGQVEVRSLVSKTVFNKIKNLIEKNNDLYDIPINDTLDQLDKIFEEELVRPRTKSEWGE